MLLYCLKSHVMYLLPILAPDANLEVYHLAAVLTPGGARGHLLEEDKESATEKEYAIKKR